MLMHRLLLNFRNSNDFVETRTLDIYSVVTVDSWYLICTDIVRNLVSGHSISTHCFLNRIVFRGQFRVYTHSSIYFLSEVIDSVPDFLLCDFSSETTRYTAFFLIPNLVHASSTVYLLIFVDFFYSPFAEDTVDVLLALERLSSGDRLGDVVFCRHLIKPAVSDAKFLQHLF